MKRIIINARFLVQPITGVQRYAREVIKALSKINQNRFEFVLIVPSEEFVGFNSSFEMFEDKSLFSGHVWEQIRLPILKRKLKGDVLWSLGNVGPIFSKKHIVTIHDASSLVGPQWFSKKFKSFYKIFLPVLGKRALKVITNSNFSKSELIKYGVASQDKIRVIPGGVSPRFQSSNENSKNKIIKGPYVLSMGFGNPRKNISMLIQAWGEIPQKAKGGRKLVILGKSDKVFSKENLKQFPHDVLLFGYAREESLPILYAGADAFVYPSLYEGFGFPPLEAMASGIPVLVSRIGSLVEICKDAALYCDPSDYKDISNQIVCILKNESLREELIKKGLEHLKGFTWKKAALEFLNVFDEMT